MLAVDRIALDLSLEKIVRVRIDGEVNRLPMAVGVLDQPDVGLVDRAEHQHPLLHFRRDDEHVRGLESGGHGLTGIHFAVDHHPVDGRGDVRILQIRFRNSKPRPGLLDVGLRPLPLRRQRHSGEPVLVSSA